MVESGHKFDFDGVKVVANDATKSGRLIKEAWLSCEGAINRHIDLRPAHAALRAWETHNRVLRNKQLNNIELTPPLQGLYLRSDRRWLRTVPPPPASSMEMETSTQMETPCQPDDRHISPAPVEASDRSGVVSYQTPQDRLGAGARRNNMRRLEATSPSSVKGELPLPYISEELCIPNVREVSDSFGVTVCPWKPHECTSERVETFQDRITMDQPSGPLNSPHLKEVTPLTKTWVERAAGLPSLRVTRSRAAEQRTGSTTIGLRPVLRRTGVGRTKDHLDRVGRLTPWDTHTAPLDDRRESRVDPQNDLRTGVRRKGRKSESRGRRSTTMKHPGEEEKREHLGDNRGALAYKEMVYPPTWCVRGSEGVAINTQDDEYELINCAKANKYAVIGRVGPVTRSRSRAQALTQV